MDIAEYRKTFELEDVHWWFISKRKFIDCALRTYIFSRSVENRLPVEILDAGCGTGGNIALLAEFGTVDGIDYSTEAIKFCKQRGYSSVKQASVNDLPLDKKRYDLITLFDVLYHQGINDDFQALRAVYNSLKPNGAVIITDSAFNWIKSKHDEAYWTRERYSRTSLRAVVEGAGFSVLKLSYIFFTIFPIVASVRLAERYLASSTRRSNLNPTKPLLNQALIRLHTAEAALLPFGNFPWGSSILCVAKKRSAGDACTRSH